MFKKLLNRRQQGFTIIEVMIVLAIAGLIMVVVLIAIPQLQRNQRNSARIADASRLGTAIQNWVTNNNGAVITAEPAKTNDNLATVISDIGSNMNQFTLTVGTTLKAEAITATPQTNTTLGNLLVVTGAKCATGGGAVATGSRSFVILYAVENSTNTPQEACIAF